MSSNIKSINLNTAFSDNLNKSNPRWVFPSIENVASLKVKNVMLPLTQNNIDIYNNKLSLIQVNSAGNTTTSNIVSLPVGQYNSNNFTTALQTGLNSAGNLNYTTTFATFGNKITITQSTGSFYFSNVDNNLYNELGLNSSQISTTTNASLIMSDPIDLSGIKQINIMSNINCCSVINKNYNILASIPIEESLNTISSFIDDSQDYIETTKEEIGDINLELRDDKFRKININKDWNLTLCIKLDE